MEFVVRKSEGDAPAARGTASDMTRFLAMNSLMCMARCAALALSARSATIFLCGADMAEAFDEDLRCAWGAQGSACLAC